MNDYFYNIYSSMKTVLFVGTSENRYRIVDDIDLEIPDLYYLDGSIVIPDEQFTELETYKIPLFSYLRDILDDEFIYRTIDPSFSNNIKDINIEDSHYMGHLPILLDMLDNTYNNSFDLIVVTSCYTDFLSKDNINKMRCVIKDESTNPSTKICILQGVPYSIDNHLFDNITYEFIKMKKFK